MWLPHDAKAKRLGSHRTVEEIIRAAGYRVRIVPKLSDADKINAARIVFGNCYFDEVECADGLQVLRHYQYDVKDGQLSAKPREDWTAHGSDAFGDFAISRRTPTKRARLSDVFGRRK